MEIRFKGQETAWQECGEQSLRFGWRDEWQAAGENGEGKRRQQELDQRVELGGCRFSYQSGFRTGGFSGRCSISGLAKRAKPKTFMYIFIKINGYSL